MKLKKKLERERKKKAKEEEQKLKEEEKQRKIKERETKKAEQAAKKAEQAAKKAEQRKRKSASTQATKVYPKRRQVQEGLVVEQTSQDTCHVCFGLYKDDIDEDTGCLLPDREWIQCCDEDCGAWSHVECLEEAAGAYVCSLC